ncbi:MAG TPA: heavy metal translocating P-type ATPase metal-binding domain-containing protein, partial [Burkholderiales bacterium]|nr:heavy metal translocating P-type ATPase metal-binding domain-containing protein [Burkholderiales bacterium]
MSDAVLSTTIAPKLSSSADARGDTACFHCGLPVPAGKPYRVSIRGEEHDVCCPGCQAVANAIVQAGLADYYRYRTVL